MMGAALVAILMGGIGIGQWVASGHVLPLGFGAFCAIVGFITAGRAWERR